MKVKKEGIVKPIERRIQNQKRQKEELKIIQNYHLIDDNERKRQREEVFEKNIKISIITPLYLSLIHIYIRSGKITVAKRISGKM